VCSARIRKRYDQQANRARRGSAGGRPAVFDKGTYKRRNIVERWSTVQAVPVIATRYDKTAMSYRGLIDVASLRMWL
jgi:transposase